MSVLDLYRSRKALVAGVGLTTRRNRVLPPAADDVPIPNRIGEGLPKLNASAVGDRTFLFSLYNGTLATLANRIAGSSALRIQATNVIVSAATYCISRLTTAAATWRDCWRIDGNTFGIRAGTTPPNVGTVAVPAHDRSALPFVANDGNYYTSCIGDPTRSTLFIGQAMESVPPVIQSISVTGTVKSSINGTNISNGVNSTAGLRIDAADKFRLYGMNISQAANAIFHCEPAWSTIQARRSTPYLQELAFGATLPVRLRGNPYLSSDNAVNHNPVLNNHTSAGYSISPTLCPYYISPSIINRSFPSPNPAWTTSWDEKYDILYNLSPDDYVSGLGETAIQRTASYVYSVDNSVAAYAYVGADIEMALTATLGVDYASHRKTAFKSGIFIGGFVGDAGAVATVSTHVKLATALAALGDLTDITCVCSGTYVYSYIYTPTVVSIPSLNSVTHYVVAYGSEAIMLAAIAVQAAPEYNKRRADTVLSTPTGTQTSERSKTLTAKTRDHIYADIDEAIYLTLEATLTLTQSETYDFGAGTWSPSNSYSLVMKYVLDVRGMIHDFPVYSGNGFSAPIIQIGSLLSGDSGDVDPIENWHTEYHPGYKPPPVFAPPFMAQGNCPYIAYTTAAEQAAGATPELYLDISIKILKYTTFTGDRYATGIVPFVPHQFLAMFRRYIGGEQHTNYPTYPLEQNAAFWDTLFPSSSPFRIQLANDVPGAWNTALGSPFGSNPLTEITRI